MAKIIEWPLCVLRPQQASAHLVPFSRSGGRSLGGVDTAVRTDLGFWAIEYGNVVMQMRHRAQWKTWQAIRSALSGRAGLIAVRVRSSLSAPYASGSFEPVAEVPHDDDTLFDDDTGYAQAAISIVSEDVTPMGATTIKLRIINAEGNLVGVKFSYEHALYETGPLIAVDGDIWTVPITPSVRAAIPHGADLDFDQPTCLCRMADDRGMDVDQNVVSKNSFPSVSFVEAVDYWNILAIGGTP